MNPVLMQIHIQDHLERLRHQADLETRLPRSPSLQQALARLLRGWAEQLEASPGSRHVLSG